MKADCTKCGKKIEIKLKKRNVREDLDEFYVECDECHATFHSFYTNAEIDKKQELIEEAIKLLPHAKKEGIWAGNKMWNYLQRLKTQKKKLMEGLERRMKKENEINDKPKETTGN